METFAGSVRERIRQTENTHANHQGVHAASRPLRPVVHQRERSTRCPRWRPRAAQASQKVCGDGTVAGVRR